MVGVSSDMPDKVKELDSPPKIVFNWPSVKVESVKYHLARRFFNSDSYIFPVLIKETYKIELIDGREGSNSNIELELWKLDTNKIEKKIWRITQEADEWKYSGFDELVFIKYGCCDSLNKYTFFNFKTGALIRSVEGKELPVTSNGN